MSSMRPGVLLCLLLLAAGCAAVRSAPTTPGSTDRRTERSAAAFHKRIVSLGGPASYPETRLNSVFDASRVHDTLLLHLNITHSYASAPHPFLTSVLPGVSFVAATHGRLYEASYTLCAITDDGRLYTAYDLNSLLRAQGFACDSTELQTMAKIAVLVAHFATPPPPKADEPEVGLVEHFPPAVELGTQAFPSVEFRSFVREVTPDPYGHGRAFNTKLTVVYNINGVAETSTVTFHGDIYGRNILRRVWSTNRHSMLFEPGRNPEPNPAEH
jgi:hypothetical protein